MPKTLLLADDSVTIQKVVGISFASEDVVLVTVDNGTAAVAKAKELRPDIVLADVVMPGLNGYEVCRAIKAAPNLRHVPVLLLTGTFEAFDEAKAREVGADGHITKPFEAQALVDTVNARLAAAAPKAPPAPAPAAAPAADAGASSLFGEEDPFDFMGDETTEPSGVRRSGSGAQRAPSAPAATAGDAYSFDDGDDLGIGEADALEAEPLEVEALTQITPEPEEPAAEIDALDGDDALEDAETLPPVDAPDFEELEADEGPAQTRVMFGQADESPDPLQATQVMLSEPVAAGVGTLTPADAGLSDPFADMIGGERGRPAHDPYDVAATDLGDPFSDDPEVAAQQAAPAATVVLASSPESPWPADDPSQPEAKPPRAAAVRTPAPAERAPAAPPAPDLRAQAMPSRDELRNLLEKLAWEAFGDLTERIVRETVQRVEQIAWDVIPKLAETLVREEIRKLKGEDE